MTSWQKSHPPLGWGKIFWLWIYPFQVILSKLWFLWQKSPPPPPGGGKIILTFDLSISGDFEQVWFLWQKSPPPPQEEGKFFDFGSIHLRRFWVNLLFVAENPPRPLGWGKIFWLWLYPFQAILTKFAFCGWKAPPLQDERNFFKFGSIHFRWFWGTLAFVVEKHLHPLDEGNFFWLWIYPFQAILSKLCFLWQKSTHPHPQDEGKFFDFGSIHFRWFWASLVFVAEKPPPGGGKIFWLWIYPFQAILSKFGSCCRKPPPPPRMRVKFSTLDLIHFRWFWPPLLFVAEKPPPPRMRENFLTLDLSISGDFEEVWLLWQRSPPPPKMREKILTSDLSISGWFWASLVFVAEKPPSQHEGKFLTLDLSISGNFEQLCFLWQKSPPPHEGKFFDFGSIHFKWFWANLVFVVE